MEGGLHLGLVLQGSDERTLAPVTLQRTLFKVRVALLGSLGGVETVPSAGDNRGPTPEYHPRRQESIVDAGRPSGTSRPRPCPWLQSGGPHQRPGLSPQVKKWR
ncbi:uncharacterized protein LOC144578433 isoform X2 [Callithrix jacchus]